MSLTPSPDTVSGRIIAAIAAKGIRFGACPMCQTNSGYTVQNEITHIPMSEAGRITNFSAIAKAFPCAVMVCNLCGHLVLLNLFAYDLDDLTGLVRQPPAGNSREI
jgi:hypothetical protein